MKIGITARAYNHTMRVRRKELGLSQARLAEASGVRLEAIQKIEGLLLPAQSIGTAKELLCRIAVALEIDFSELFPQDYLDAIQHELLPRRRVPVEWVREVRMGALPVRKEPALIGPSAEDEFILQTRADDMKDALDGLLGCLSEHQRAVLSHRYGLDGGDPKTLRDISDVLVVTPERVRQIEMNALRKLRAEAGKKRVYGVKD